MLLGDARSGKLSDNITGFARALRRAGLPIDASRISLAIDSTEHVGIERKDDLSAALKACLVSRQEDLVVFDQMFSALFRDPELTRQLLSQLLPQSTRGHTGCAAQIQSARGIGGQKQTKRSRQVQRR
jgi:uncharacterized protein